MPTITFVQKDGREQVVTASPDDSVMQAATNDLVPGILADCGGAATCGTCHVFASAETMKQLPSPQENEALVIEGLLESSPSSRLACQITVCEEIDGAVFHVPAPPR